LSAALDEAHAPDAYGRAMVGERALFLFAMGEDISVHTFPGGSPSRLGRAVPNVLYTAVGLRDLDRIAWLQLTREVIEARKGDSTARTARIQQAEAQIPSYCILTRLVSGAYSRAMESDMRAVARIDAARVAVALERHRLANGKLPEALSELVPLYLDEVPTDPFDGKPLRYKKLENGYTVYSVGQDGADDGGETEGLRQPGGYYQEPPDTGLTIRRPKAEPSQSEDTDE